MVIRMHTATICRLHASKRSGEEKKNKRQLVSNILTQYAVGDQNDCEQNPGFANSPAATAASTTVDTLLAFSGTVSHAYGNCGSASTSSSVRRSTTSTTMATACPVGVVNSSSFAIISENATHHQFSLAGPISRRRQ